MNTNIVKRLENSKILEKRTQYLHEYAQILQFHRDILFCGPKTAQPPGLPRKQAAQTQKSPGTCAPGLTFHLI